MPSLRAQTHSAFRQADMQVYRQRLRARRLLKAAKLRCVGKAFRSIRDARRRAHAGHARFIVWTCSG